MRQLLPLLGQTLKRTRVLVLTLGVVLGLFQVIMIVVARSIANSGAFEQLATLFPPFVRDLLGPSMVSFLSFRGIVCVGYFDVPVLVALVGLAIALATTPVADLESGFLDLVLSRPLARHWIVTRTIVASTLVIVLVVVLMFLGTRIGLQALIPDVSAWPPASMIFSLGANLALLAWCWAGIALAIGAGSRRRGFAGGVAALAALASMLLDYVARLWEPAQSITAISPFHYFSPFDLVMGDPLPLKNVVVLAAMAVGGFMAAYALFSRRDLTH
jgi:beta-exotoxin I transport system permease protein